MSNPFTRKEVTQVKTDFKEKVKDYSPERRMQLISQQAKIRDMKRELTRQTKTALMVQKKANQEQSLHSKFQKFEWRMNKPVTST